MILREILQKLEDEGNRANLSNGNGAIDPGTLLQKLSAQMLERQAYLQPGLYIAEINESGYLGQVLFRFVNET